MSFEQENAFSSSRYPYPYKSSSPEASRTSIAPSMNHRMAPPSGACTHECGGSARRVHARMRRLSEARARAMPEAWALSGSSENLYWRRCQ